VQVQVQVQVQAVSSPYCHYWSYMYISGIRPWWARRLESTARMQSDPVRHGSQAAPASVAAKANARATSRHWLQERAGAFICSSRRRPTFIASSRRYPFIVVVRRCTRTLSTTNTSNRRQPSVSLVFLLQTAPCRFEPAVASPVYCQALLDLLPLSD
jgi:hypothetical protein